MAIGHSTLRSHTRSKGQSMSPQRRTSADCDSPISGPARRTTTAVASAVRRSRNTDSWALDLPLSQSWPTQWKEGRKNWQVRRYLQVAGPHELDDAQPIALTKRFADDVAERFGLASKQSRKQSGVCRPTTPVVGLLAMSAGAPIGNPAERLPCRRHVAFLPSSLPGRRHVEQPLPSPAGVSRSPCEK